MDRHIVSDRLACVVIEAAICPIGFGDSANDTETIVREAKACLAAGASIVHHHHHVQLEREAAIEQLIAIYRAVQSEYPSALLYPAFLRGKGIEATQAHIEPMRQAGVLRMLAVDPGLVLRGEVDARGLLSESRTSGMTWAEAKQVVALARRADVPISLGVFEPGHLRWILNHSAADQFPPGSIVKLNFNGCDRTATVGAKGQQYFGLPPTRAALDVYLSMMEGCDLPWMVSLQGGVMLESRLAQYALERGGHLRVGNEDAAGRTPMSNREAVEAAIALANKVGRPLVRRDEVRAVLTRRSTGTLN